jgi:hypothetical protein
LRREVVGGRVDQVARQEDAVADAGKRRRIGCRGLGKPRRAIAGRAVAVEPVAAEGEGERGERGLVEAGGEAVCSGRQGGGKLAGEKRPALGGVAAAETEKHAADIAVRVRNDDVLTGLGLERLRPNESARALVKAFEHGLQLVRAHALNGDRLPVVIRTVRTDLHSSSFARWSPARAVPTDNSVNEPSPHCHRRSRNSGPGFSSAPPLIATNEELPADGQIFLPPNSLFGVPRWVT